ncbi:MAG: S8 family serine peptidase, partial [Bdellovibrionaceae bacterium]|nr:S8 family serine peptidase [Pseudobdellovibrionaceae bacterium]
MVEEASYFHRPSKLHVMSVAQSLAQAVTSVSFIGAPVWHRAGFTGKGLRVGIIDTGIDYTHVALGGSGKVEDFNSIHPELPTVLFPNKKVVGGIDLVGENYNPYVGDAAEIVPVPDPNPIDLEGHGTHVAGTVAGLATEKLYAGVAYDAELYAIKVFGKEETTDYVVCAAIEYALDPNGDLDLSDRLDVVNLSLGGAFGGAKILYQEVMRRASQKGGMIVVAAAGNDGPVDFVTAAPATADHVLSVAASVDGSKHNIEMLAIKVEMPSSNGSEERLMKAIPATFSEKITEPIMVVGTLADMGLGLQPIPVDAPNSVSGKIALIKRGEIEFLKKAKNALNSGAIAVIIYNNNPGEGPLLMGGDEALHIPVLMISLEDGEQLLHGLKNGLGLQVTIGNSFKIVDPSRADKITVFSSKGPRIDDLLIKPEIAAPGQAVLAAKVGTGVDGVLFSGTSMASPHMAGAMALLKQRFPYLKPAELKALAINYALPLNSSSNKEREKISLQGGGRVDLERAFNAFGFTQPATLSFGLVQLNAQKVLRKPITFTNLKDTALRLRVGLEARKGGLVSLRSGTGEVVVEARKSKTFSVDLVLHEKEIKSEEEVDGWVTLEPNDGSPSLRIPFLMVVKKVSNVKGTELRIHSDPHSPQGAAAEVTLANAGRQVGRVLPFNLLGLDPRKKKPNDVSPSVSDVLSRNCDIQSVGYRILGQGRDEVLQIAVKLFNPVVRWSRCEVVALFDHNRDGVIDQELAYVTAFMVPGLAGDGIPRLAELSVLFDGEKMRTIRSTYEMIREIFPGLGLSPNYWSAVQNIARGFAIPYSTIVVMEVPARLIQRAPTGEVYLKVAAQDYSGLPIQADDFFKPNGAEGWLKMSLNRDDQGFTDLPTVVMAPADGSTILELVHGGGQHDLLLLLPDNIVNYSEVVEDQQQMILKPQYLF